MERDLNALLRTMFDLVVIGGGINGAATAREAAMRGLKVALVEAQDFASGTSSRSSKLIHGGLRYLEQFDFKLVHESRRERRLLLNLAPHLARPLPFLLPIYHGDPYYPLKIRLGLTVYDLMGNLGRADRHRMLNPQEALRRVPALRPEGLRAAAIYHDSETDDARLTLENVLDAAEHGAVVANYTAIRALALASRSGSHGGTLATAEAEDCLTGRRHEISSRFWVNAAGPWVDHVRALIPAFDGSKTIRLTKGTHVILPPVTEGHALFAAILADKRVFLMLPWHDYSLLGTTDTDFDGDPASVQPDAADAEYLLGAANRVLRQPLRASQVLGSFTGLRALVYEPGRSPSATTREYRFHEDSWAKNLISICGGKLTTARALGEKLVERIVASLEATPPDPLGRHPSRRVPLPGGHTGPFEAFVKSASRRAAEEFHLPPATAERIVRTYGSRWPLVLGPLRAAKDLATPLPGTPALLAAEVEFAIRHEMAITVEDFLLRRSGLNWAACTLRAAAPAVAEIFAARFGWNAEQRRAALDSFGRCAQARDWGLGVRGSGFGVRRSFPAPSP
jgi:glycerol-3-phosphate dehydrogenase